VHLAHVDHQLERLADAGAGARVERQRSIACSSQPFAGAVLRDPSNAM
jgi:hypothetical protein